MQTKENERLRAASEKHDRQRAANAAIGAAQAEAVRVAIEDGDIGAILDIASAPANLEPVYAIKDWLKDHPNAEIAAVLEEGIEVIEQYHRRQFFVRQNEELHPGMRMPVPDVKHWRGENPPPDEDCD